MHERPELRVFWPTVALVIPRHGGPMLGMFHLGNDREMSAPAWVAAMRQRGAAAEVPMERMLIRADLVEPINGFPYRCTYYLANFDRIVAASTDVPALLALCETLAEALYERGGHAPVPGHVCADDEPALALYEQGPGTEAP